MKLRTLLAVMLSFAVTLFAILAYLIADSAFLKTDDAILHESLSREVAYLSSQVKRNGIQKDMLDEYAKMHAIRLTLVNLDGTVLYDNEREPEAMDNHAWRKEIEMSLKGGEGFSIRHSQTLKTNMVYVAKMDGDLIVRISCPVSAISTWRNNFKASFFPLLVVFLLLLLLFEILLVSHLLKPLSQISDAATKWSEGKLSHHLFPQGPKEFQIIARTMNATSNALSRRMRESEEEKARYASILDTMVEGVILVDNNGSLVLENHASKCAEGATLLQNPAIAHTIHKTLRSDCIQHATSRYKENLYAITSAPIHEKNTVIGAVLTINDITRIQHLEQMRQDFVANVSHELKTPLTSILGFSDILAKDHLEEEERIHYATIILKGAKRMQGIITDLLTLSSLETEGKQFPMEQTLLPSLIDEAMESVRYGIEQKGMTIKVDCPEILVTCARSLLVEAISNLLSNAIRYSPEHTEILISARKNQKKETIISVTDQGCGISQEDQRRIFERFYRVDKARSRSQGGTGLGLSIVRHVMMIHQGKVEVESELGKGSTFRLVF